MQSSPKDFIISDQSSLFKEFLSTSQQNLQQEPQDQEAKEEDPQSKMIACGTLADNLFKQNKYTDAILQYEQAINCQRTIKSHYDYAAKCYQELASCYLRTDNIKGAILALEESLINYNTSSFSATPDEQKQITAKKVEIYFDLATIYKNKDKFERAKGFALEGLKLNKTILSTAHDQADLDRNANGLAILTDCERPSLPRPVLVARAISDKENVSNQDNPIQFTVLQSFSKEPNQNNQACNFSPSRSPLIESTVFKTTFHLIDADPLQLDNTKTSKAQPEKKSNLFTK